jgi:hypothetical protein
MANPKPEFQSRKVILFLPPRRILGSHPFNNGWRFARSKREYGTNGSDGTDGKP